ncbi:MAG TPA: PilT/PilU family type 4a pilus ATPase [Opitutales bacterium]|jgi:twitching motility protein PilT|nr:PilT/PilU family type 4a pilus ATPase [Opitutales bacterium]
MTDSYTIPTPASDSVAEPLDSQRKIYRAGEHTYSMVDLLASAVSPEYLVNGMPRVSDFHFKVGEPVCFRLDNELQRIPGGVKLTPELIEPMVFSLLRADDIAQLRKNPLMDVDASFELPGQKYYFRINVFHDRDGLAAVIRLLPPFIPRIEELGFLSELPWRSIVTAKQGLVLVTGVTGSGKSTTIASMLARINETRAVRVITLEDPVEFVFSNKRALFSQREIGLHATSFASGLRSVLRENPDIIYVGEIRDAETASQALTAAETGHLVVTTMHTRDTVGALTRLVDMFPSDRTKELLVQMSFSLSFVLSQKLIPRADGQGRCVAMEVLRNTPALSNLIRTGNWQQIYGSIETRTKEGMNTLEQALISLFERRIITMDDAINHANDASIVDRLESLENTPRKRMA